MLDSLGEFLTKSHGENMFQNTIFNSPEQFAYMRERAILATTGIPYYEESLQRELKMSWGLKGVAREQIVTVASAVKDGSVGEFIDSSAIVTEEEYDDGEVENE